MDLAHHEGASAPVAEGEGVASSLPIRVINYVNRTDAQFAPKSISRTIATRQRVKDWGIPTLRALAPHGRPAILVGSSPYVVGFLDEIRAKQKDGAVVFAINSAHNLMLDEGIPLSGTVLFEGGPDRHVKKFRLPQKDVVYYIASHCHPHQYEALKDCQMVVWHAQTDLIEQTDEFLKFLPTKRPIIPEIDGEKFMDDGTPATEVYDFGILGGGATTFTRALNIQMYLGFRDWDLYGFDSSFEEHGESHHDMSKVGADLPTQDTRFMRADGFFSRVFWGKPFMQRQAIEFMDMVRGTGDANSPNNPWPRLNAKIRLHGPGLLPSWHRDWCPEQYR